MFSLIQCYLEDCKQRLRINNSVSRNRPVISGTPQSPIIWQLFLLFIKDFPLALTTTILGYTDDIKAILKNQNKSE